MRNEAATSARLCFGMTTFLLSLRTFEAVTGPKRASIAPEIPTVAEAGLPGYVVTGWFGLLAPAQTPPAIVERLNAEIRKIVNSPEVKEGWAKQGAAPMSMSTDEFAHYLRDDVAKWAQVVKVSGAKVD